MPLTLPNLDDRRYADLAAEARALIPTYAPESTNHNPSDPGVTLLELISYLSELLVYRGNRVTDANILAFLPLIDVLPCAVALRLSLLETIRAFMAVLGP